MRKFMLYLLLSTTLLSEQINIQNIRNYIYSSTETTKEYKVIVDKGMYYLIDVQSEKVEYRGDTDKDIDGTLSYMKQHKFVIERESGKLEIQKKGESDGNRANTKK